MSSIEKIVSKGFCIGCGLCQDIGNEYGYSMVLNKDGFYVPVRSELKTDESIPKKIKKICPGINVRLRNSSGVWGNIKALYNAWSSDPIIRKKGSSGGVVTALAVYMLESKKADAILHVGRREDHFMHNCLHVSRTREEVLAHASSRYAPALVLDHITEIFKNSEETYVFIGKPCDITALKNYLEEYPQYASRIRYYISIFCAGMPSYNATLDLLKQAQQDELPTFLKYRGDGWPGKFEAFYKMGDVFSVSYNESWGKVLGKQIHFRCKICPDGIGLFADIVAADSWNTKDGYPDFEEQDGRSFLIARNVEAEAIIQEAVKANAIKTETLEVNSIKDIQPYQYLKRFVVGYRIFAVQICSLFALHFSGFQLFKRMIGLNPIKGIRIGLGTARRWMFRK